MAHDDMFDIYDIFNVMISLDRGLGNSSEGNKDLTHPWMNLPTIVTEMHVKMG